MSTSLRTRLARVLATLTRTADVVPVKTPADRYVRMAIAELGEDAAYVDLFDHALDAYVDSLKREVSDMQFERMSEAVDDSLHRLLNQPVTAAKKAVTIKFAPFAKPRIYGDTSESEITVDGVRIGEIVRDMDMEFEGMRRVYTVGGYRVELFGTVNGVVFDIEKDFPAERVPAKTALKSAKEFVRAEVVKALKAPVTVTDSAKASDAGNSSS